MMPSTSENLTRPNKQSRINDGTTSKRMTRHSPDKQATGPMNIKQSTAATIADPRNFVGSRLETIMEDLASQPKGLQTIIIEFQNSMLDKLVIIRHRTLSGLRFPSLSLVPKLIKE
jgi:hypothetical protein